MKKTSLLIIILILIGVVQAAYLKDFPQSLQQPDGTRFKAYRSGDEFYNWLHDKDGFTIIQNDRGYYVYAEAAPTGIRPGARIVGRELPLGLEKGLSISKEELELRRGRRSRTPESSRWIGDICNLVVFLKFADDAGFNTPFEEYSSIFNSAVPGDTSLRAYYDAVSYGQLEVNSHLFPEDQDIITCAYTDIRPRGYYLPQSFNNPGGYVDFEYGDRENELIQRVYQSLAADLPPDLDTDCDNDGYVDNLTIMICGSTGAWGELLWPHAWGYEQPDGHLFLNGAILQNYNIQLEDYVAFYGTSVLMHEFFHTLGAPDLYRYVDSSVVPVGYWDPMGSAAEVPQHMLSISKYLYGSWLPAPTPLFNSGTYTLYPLSSSTGTRSYRITSWVSGEHYILEYRKIDDQYEQQIPGTGLIVYRYLPQFEGNASGPPDGVYIYRPGAGTNSQPGDLGAAAMSAQSGFVSICESTIPSGFSTDEDPGGLYLYDVGMAGETISFSVKISDIQVINPHHGDTYVAGDSLRIKWADKFHTGLIRLEYSIDNGTNWSDIASSYPNSGYYDWQIPPVESSLCLIRISLLGTYSQDTMLAPFSILSALEAPVLVLPENNQEGVATNPQLSWNAVPAAQSYRLELSCDPQFSTLDREIVTQGTTAQVNLLSAFTQYYWRVYAKAINLWSPASQVLTFHTGAVSESPEIPSLLSPGHQSQDICLNPVLRWQEADLAEFYHLQVARNAYFTESLTELGPIAGTSYALSGLEPYCWYYWRVSAGNSFGSSLYSTSRRFRTGDWVANNDDTESPQPLSLSAVYPNPFNPEARVSLYLPKSGEVTLDVYNLRGQLVKTLYNGVLSQGTHSFSWDATDEHGINQASGIYIFRLSNPGELQTRRAILLK